MSRVEGNICSFQFFFEKVIIDAINRKQMAREHRLVVGWGGGEVVGIEKSSGTSQFFFSKNCIYNTPETLN